MKLQYDIYSRANQYVVDGVIVGVSFLLAYLLRFEGQVPETHRLQMWVLLPIVIASRLSVNVIFRIYRQIWRYIGIGDAFSLLLSYTTVSAVLLLLRLGLPARWALYRVPLSIIAMEFLFSLYGAGGVRILRRVLYQWELRRGSHLGKKKRLLLVGAGSAGVIAAKELSLRPDIEIVGFVEDFPKIQGSRIAGFPILGSTGRITELVRKHGVDEVVLCLARAPVATLKRLWRLCEGTPARTLIIPTLHEIFDREVGISRLREISMEDLLGRETLHNSSTQPELLDYYRGKRILITGAGGSIGAELTRQLAGMLPARLLLMDKDENGLYELQVEFEARTAKSPYELLVGDIRNDETVRNIFRQFRPEIVFHAAAHKHVPLMESNPAEAVLNNVFGTMNVVEQAIACETAFFVLISSDKAVKPSSVMGASKRLAELLVQSKTNQYSTHFACVRFGNVMSSRGSVIPFFQKQIAAGGPITLTDLNVSRYFMTIPEAVHLVLHVGLLKGDNGTIYVLDMGDPIQIVRLARDLIELSGLRPDHDIRIQVIGLRPGEKVREELVGDGEFLIPTNHETIRAVRSSEQSRTERLQSLFGRLREAARRHNAQEIYRVFQECEIGYQAPTANSKDANQLLGVGKKSARDTTAS